MNQPRIKKLQVTNESLATRLIRYILIAFLDAGAVWFIYQAFTRGFDQIAIVIAIITILLNLVFFLPQAYAFRWMAIGLAFLTLFAIYPIIFTFYVAFTNYGDGHLLTKEQALPKIENITYLPEGAPSYSWTAYKSSDGHYALWLVDSEGNSFLGKENETIISAKPGDSGIGEADSKGIPASIEGYERINSLTAVTDKNLPSLIFGKEGEAVVQITSPTTAAALEQRFIYDTVTDSFTDQSNGNIYNNVEGTYSTYDGKTITPGFRAGVGWKNFKDFLTSPTLRGPLVTILIWNFIFPLVSVFSTFAMGLAIAIMYNDKNFPLKKVIRTLLLIPYTIPSVITILIWRGMLSPQFGIINRTILGACGSFTRQPLAWFPLHDVDH
jgi:arabinogalactan oligomer/maltooligosaccharide transport system permease protein